MSAADIYHLCKYFIQICIKHLLPEIIKLSHRWGLFALAAEKISLCTADLISCSQSCVGSRISYDC